MIKFIEQRQLISAFAPNVPDFVCANAIRESCRMFFRKTHAYLTHQDECFVAGDNVLEFSLFEPEIEFVALVRMQYNDFDPISIETRIPNMKTTGKPRVVKVLENQMLNSYPVADKDYSVMLTIAVRPSFDAQEIDEQAYSRNEEAIRYGALAILKAQPQTEWYSPEEVSYYQGLFDQQVNQKKIDTFKNESAINLDIEVPRFL